MKGINFKIRARILFTLFSLIMSQFNFEKIAELKRHNCKNCELNYEGFFCNRCGQRFLDGRFTFKESLGWIFDKIFNLERGVLYTTKELIIRPRVLLTNFLNKATVRYINPFRYAFFLATITALVTIISGTFESEEMSGFLQNYVEGWNEGRTNSSDKMTLEDTRSFIENIKKYLAFIFILFIPFYALSTYIVYYRKKYNFTEHLIINCYAYSFSLILALPLFIVMFFKNGIAIYSTFNSIFYFVAYIYIFGRFFKENFFISFFKILLVVLITIVLMMIAGVLVLLGYVFITKVFG